MHHWRRPQATNFRAFGKPGHLAHNFLGGMKMSKPITKADRLKWLARGN
jgi:hypothetical protein